MALQMDYTIKSGATIDNNGPLTKDIMFESAHIEAFDVGKVNGVNHCNFYVYADSSKSKRIDVIPHVFDDGADVYESLKLRDVFSGAITV